jgi:hypothetical protein
VFQPQRRKSGIDTQTVTKWRRLLNVERGTQGTTQLFREHICEIGDAMRVLGVLKARDPERRRKITEARRGKPRPAHVGEAVRSAHLGVPHTKETKQRMGQSEARALELRHRIGSVR